MKKYRLIKHNSDNQMRWGDNADTRKHLTVGEIYDAEVEVYSWHTKLIINEKKFNNVCFEEIQENKNARTTPNQKTENETSNTETTDFPENIRP